MHERLQEPDEQQGEAPRPGFAHAAFPFAPGAQMITALQQSAGNQSVTRMLLREPAAAPPAAAPEVGIVPICRRSGPTTRERRRG